MTDLLRNQLLELLRTTEDFVARAGEATSTDEAKLWIRRAHDSQRRDRLDDATAFIAAKEDSLLTYFANGRDVDPEAIDPVVSPVITELDSDLWRYASLTWSVPVSQGYGRRTKFLVRDRSNNKVIAIFALGDPVIGLQVRDSQIGWSQEQRHKRLYNVYDAFVLGAVDPYRQLLAGKLVALLAISNETRRFLSTKYSGTQTVIRGESKNPTPVLVTTSSALGKSSIYNRLTYRGHKAYSAVGYTTGFGHFHISENMFEQLVLLLRSRGLDVGAQFGKGANYRFRVIRTALTELGLPADGLRHGIRREVYLAPLATNWREYLCGETDIIEPIDMPSDDISSYFRERWAVPRAHRRADYESWDKNSMRLSNHLPNAHVQYSLSLAFDNAQIVKPRETTGIRVGNATLFETKQTSPSSESVTQQNSVSDEISSQVAFGASTFTVVMSTSPAGVQTVRAIHVDGGPAEMEALVNRSPLTVERSILHNNLAFVELRAAVAGEDGRANLRKLNAQALQELLGGGLQELLPRASGFVLGTRRELFRDTSRRGSELCVLFPSDNLMAPFRVWTVIRLLTFAASLQVPQEAPTRFDLSGSSISPQATTSRSHKSGRVGSGPEVAATRNRTPEAVAHSLPLEDPKGVL